MLPREHRLVRSAEFSDAVRAGRRAGDGVLVVHLARTGSVDAARVGFVVSKAVGGAVVRNRVKRRLRHIVAARIHDLSTGDLVVVRALPKAADEPFGELAASFDRCLVRAARTERAPVEAS